MSFERSPAPTARSKFAKCYGSGFKASGCEFLMKKKTTKIKTRPWDVAEHLATEEDMAAYLEAALEDGAPALVAATLGDIARAKGMSEIARETGLGRKSLYKALSPDGNPEFSTVASAWPPFARGRRCLKICRECYGRTRSGPPVIRRRWRLNTKTRFQVLKHLSMDT